MSSTPRFAILRTQKLKHLASVSRSLKHSFREQDTPNADPSRTPENSHFGAGSVAEAMAAVEARLPEKRRKDAVLAIEYLVAASPEAMQGKSREQQDAYFADSLAWLKERHGAENVVYAGIHRDETTPHMYAYVVPLDPESGRLNTKKWLGGSKALNQMQTEFANQIGKRHGLERGIERSKATHQTIRQHYAAIQQGVAPRATISPQSVEPKVLEKAGLLGKLRGQGDLVETSEDIAERLTDAINAGFAGTVAAASMAAQERRRAKELQRTADDLRKRLEALQEPFKGLSKDQMAKVLQMAASLQQENAKTQELRKDQIRQQLSRDRGGIER